LGVVGESGSGKSTLLNIISGIIKPDSGKVETDNIDIFENLKIWQKKIGYVSQNPIFLDDSIKKNIAFGINENEINEKKIWDVLELANLKEHVNNLENGINTEIGERGIKFSGGQSQRISIARALYRSCDILILDEATSALDSDTEMNILNEISKLSKQNKLTVIIVSHRENIKKYCNKLIKL